MDDSLAELTREVLAFRDARDWARFHRPKDLVLGLAAEVGEVAEVVLWKDDADLAHLAQAGPLRERLAEELADVLTFVLYLGAAAHLDLGAALRAKLALNARRYPVERARGNPAKYTEL